MYRPHRKAIMDYQKTVELYEKNRTIERWEDTPESDSYKGEQAWYDRVKSKRTGEFHQVDELRREWVPADWKPPHQDAKGKPIKCPLKHVSEIIGKRLADGSEWLITRQQH